MMWIYAAFLLLGVVSCQNNIPVDLQDIEKTLGDIPALQNVNQNAIPSFDDIENALKKKCDKNGGPDAFDKLDPARDALQDCIQSNFDFELIQNELQAARKTGSMDEVFAKYCLKTPIVQKCFENMTSTIEPCLDEEEKSSLKVLLNITYSLTDFLCYKDGDRLAMFVAEGGFECIEEKSEGLKDCLNKTIGNNVPNLSTDDLPSLVINSERCDKFDELQNCAVTVLETCKDTTPANIMEALFKYVRRITPCNEISPRRPKRDIGMNGMGGMGGMESQDPLAAAYDSFIVKFEPHCKKNGGDKAADELRQELANTKTCQETQIQALQNTLSRLQQQNDNSFFSYICTDFKTGSRRCLDRLVSKVEVCSSKEEKYLPKFGLQLYDSVMAFFCKEDGKVIKNLITEPSHCGTILKSTGASCLSKTKHIQSANSESIVTKDELCGDLKVLKGCFLDIVQKNCEQDHATRDFVTGLGDAIYAPCSGCRFFLSNFLLLVIVLFFTKWF